MRDLWKLCNFLQEELHFENGIHITRIPVNLGNCTFFLDNNSCRNNFFSREKKVSARDKARIEQIRSDWNLLLRYENREGFPDYDVTFLLAQLDSSQFDLMQASVERDALKEVVAHIKINLETAHAALREIRDLSPMHERERRTIARKALDGSTDPDTGTKGSLGEE